MTEIDCEMFRRWLVEQQSRARRMSFGSDPNRARYTGMADILQEVILHLDEETRGREDA